ncbi:glyoxalase family protein [Candidatus Gracilibacteria bacterium CG17_big_fil_post_rev_8_21_14_2_50_48_13]|nr:MAG: glyoxalase family protein [Candidatus Gracilibacteria bacterium CG17_big_fil_post_rev_8_21_14_2_50_48_13]
MRHHTINYIELGARNISALKVFYGEVFGWTFQDFGPEYAAFHDGHMEGGFAQNAPIGAAPLVILYSNALESTRDSILAAGGAITQDIYDFPGGRRFHFTDPDGNGLAVWSKI